MTELTTGSGFFFARTKLRDGCLYSDRSLQKSAKWNLRYSTMPGKTDRTRVTEILRQMMFVGRRAPQEFRCFVVLAAWILCLVPRAATAVTFATSLDRDTISLGESVTLGLKFDGGGPQTAPSLPNLPDLDVSYLGPASQFTLVNGQASSSITHNFNLHPRKAGEFTIPAFSLQIDGVTLTSQPLKLTVLKANAPTPDAIKAGAQNAFLKLVLPRKEIYLGDTMTAELQLYLSDRVQNIERFQFTALPAEGFSLGKVTEDQGGQRRVQIGSATYRMVRLLFTVRPVKTGTFTIGPVTASAVIQTPSRNRQRDPFEAFGFRGMFGGGEQQQISLVTDPETVQALALPTGNVPPGFNGAVGTFTMNVSAGPTNVAAGDPVTVRVQITGRGALDALTLPEQPAWRDFKTFPPTSKVEPDPADGFGLRGTKTFEQVVMPQNSEIKALPPLSFSFFDPDKKAYCTLTQAAIPLVVRPSASASVPVVLTSKGAAQEAPRPAQDIVHIKPRPGMLAQAGSPWVLQPWFLWLQVAPIALWAAVLAWRKRAEAFARNPRLRREREVAQLVREGLLELRRSAAENKSEEFFACLARLLQEQIGERLDLPASAITEAVIEEHLQPRGVPKTLLAPLQELFHICNLARYAPIKSSQELTALIPRLESVLRDLQGLKL